MDIGCQIRDQNPPSVRTHLPVAVGILDKAIREKLKEPGQTVYLHCHAGLGRSPSVAAAYLYWFTDDITVSFRFSTCIYAPCKYLSSADLFIVVLQLLILSDVLVCHLIVRHAYICMLPPCFLRAEGVYHISLKRQPIFTNNL